MKDLVKLVTDWATVKTAKNPSPEIEARIEETRTLLHEQVGLLRLSNAELTRTSKELRFSVMQELIDDVARY